MRWLRAARRRPARRRPGRGGDRRLAGRRPGAGRLVGVRHEQRPRPRRPGARRRRLRGVGQRARRDHAVAGRELHLQLAALVLRVGGRGRHDPGGDDPRDPRVPDRHPGPERRDRAVPRRLGRGLRVHRPRALRLPARGPGLRLVRGDGRRAAAGDGRDRRARVRAAGRPGRHPGDGPSRRSTTTSPTACRRSTGSRSRPSPSRTAPFASRARCRRRTRRARPMPGTLP